MFSFVEQLRIAERQTSPLIKSPQETIRRINGSLTVPEPVSIYARVNTRLFTRQQDVIKIDQTIGIQDHMEILRDYINQRMPGSVNRWRLVNAHGVTTEFTPKGEIYKWYEGYMLTREVVRKDKVQRRGIGREYFFVGRFSDQIPETIAQQLHIPRNPRVFAGLSPTDIIVTSGISWVQDVKGYCAPTIVGNNFTTNNPAFHRIKIPDGEAIDTLLGLNQANAIFEAELAEQAAKQITRSPSPVN